MNPTANREEAIHLIIDGILNVSETGTIHANTVSLFSSLTTGPVTFPERASFGGLVCNFV